MSDNHETGYKKPPKHTQWKKGQSGNPKGRPKGTKNFKTDLEEELLELIQISEGGRVRTVSKQRAIIKRAIEQALKGEMRAIEGVLKWSLAHLTNDESPEGEAALNPDDTAILERFLASKGAPRTDPGESNGGAA